MQKRVRTTGLFLAVMFSSILALPSQSWADILSTFDLSGTFANLQIGGIPLSGSVTVDTTTGVIQSQTVFPATNPLLPVTFTQGFDASAKAYFFNVTDTLDDADIFFDTATLVNYNGGNLGSVTSPTAGGATSLYNGQLLPNNIPLKNGVATPEAVPEPGSAMLLFAGLGSLALLLQLRSAT